PDPAASTARRPGVVAMPRFRFSRWTGAGVRPRDVQPLRTTGGSDAPDPPEEPESPGMSSTPIRPRLLPPRHRRKTQRSPEPPLQPRPGERPLRQHRAPPARTAPAPPATRGFRSGSRIVDGKAPAPGGESERRSVPSARRRSPSTVQGPGDRPISRKANTWPRTVMRSWRRANDATRTGPARRLQRRPPGPAVVAAPVVVRARTGLGHLRHPRRRRAARRRGGG